MHRLVSSRHSRLARVSSRMQLFAKRHFTMRAGATAPFTSAPRAPTRAHADASRARRTAGASTTARARVGRDEVDEEDDVANLHRRRLLFAFASAASTVAANAHATSNTAVSDAWSAVTGSMSDLTFPKTFLGNWLVESRTASASAPLGREFVRDIGAFERISRETTLTEPLVYPLRFMENARGDVVFDRAFNVRALAEASRGSGGRRSVDGDIEWSVDDPNVLKLTSGDGARVFYKVTARSMDRDDEKRTITTSELAQVVVDRAGAGAAPSVKSTRVVTKFKWRTPEQANGGPQIVASQTVYEYLVAGAASDDDFIAARGRPVEVDVYRLAMVPWTDA